MSDDVVAHRKIGSWRQRASAHIAVVQAELDRIEGMEALSGHDKKLADKAHQLLHGARQATDSWPPFWAAASARDRTLATIHEAELIVLKLTPAQEIGWAGSTVLAKGIQHLGQEDPRLKLLEEHLREHNNMLDDGGRHLAADVLHAANHTEEVEIARVRNFRNILLLTFLALSAFTVLLILSGYQNPAALADKLCFRPPAPTPEDTNAKDYVCPVGQGPADGDNVLLVASLGAASAALAGATSIRHIRGSAVPYMVPMSLLILRIPIGALSAILGLVLIHGEFIPGLSALDSGAQIAAWAVAFGIGQESLTRLLDKKGNLLLENVRGSARAVESPPPPTDMLIKPVLQPGGPNGAKPGGDGATDEEAESERTHESGEEAVEQARPHEEDRQGG
ncbi:hypothetical protein BN159_6186 [Streptomyces davaonensis JCM 4913]|uniref:Uncharacterized protein n=1 Tax=Streptomyces davaonensis (strain DSM 101723 / JCM 4913 / KCC S-0913 / 768) TaxID=1214101 RepID=K4RBF8_STRDJ|nr:hypothetical protein [Streptomyces davaonensis]CCK30565.1 hypothetical protein BN159_6186 [Streptomyces davaonensis JCM 4913]